MHFSRLADRHRAKHEEAMMQTISALKHLHNGFRPSSTTPASGQGEIKQVPCTDIRHASAVSDVNIISTSDSVQKVFRK